MFRSALAGLIAVVLTTPLCAQTSENSPGQIPAPASSPDHRSPESPYNYDLPPGADPQNRLLLPFLYHLAQDQKHFWTMPAHTQKRDLKWILPAAGATAGLIAADSWISRQVPNRPNQLNRSRTISNYSLYSLIGAGGGAFLLGKLSHNDHMRETGLLAAEAAINATGVTYTLKVATERERPYHGNGEGDFFSGAPSSNRLSFPSEHAALAWSIASVAAHEYPGPVHSRKLPHMVSPLR